MTTKLGRNYIFQAETALGTTITVKPPFTLFLDITRNILNSANVCQVRLYNLSLVNRNQLYYNQSDYPGGFFRKISLQAGYGSNLALIFQGNITQAWSVREGTNFVTTIECMDGGSSYSNDVINIQFPARTSLQFIIQSIMKSLSNVSVGGIGDFTGVIPRANTYYGSPSSILFELTGGGFFIDNGKAYAMKSSEYIPNLDSISALPTTTVSNSTGLLNTPVLERTLARFEMLFEPSLNPGFQVLVNTSTFPALNGVYKINSVKHRGVISEVMSGNLITIADFYRNTQGTALAPITLVPQ